MVQKHPGAASERAPLSLAHNRESGGGSADRWCDSKRAFTKTHTLPLGSATGTGTGTEDQEDHTAATAAPGSRQSGQAHHASPSPTL